MSNFSNFSNQHRYALDKGSKKFYCPDCEKKRFVRFIDIETGNYLPEQYGRCDREADCRYFLNPYYDGYAKAILEQERSDRSDLPNWKPRRKVIPQPTPEPIFFDFETFRQTLQPERYEKNTFIQNLFRRVEFPFEVNEVTKVVQLYRLGTVVNGYRAGAITFPFIDIRGNVRAIQVKTFDDQNHTTGTDFLHSIIEKHYTQNNKPVPNWLEAYINQDKRISCLFGAQLLGKYPNAEVYLFEAPKSAVYSTLYFGHPEISNIICLAVYNKSSFSFDKIKVLQGRFVYVFPDLSKDGNTFKEWETKAKDYENRLQGTRFIFSNLLEQLAPEQDKNKANDLGDYLIKQDWRLFRKQNIKEQPPQPETEKVTGVTKVTFPEKHFFSHEEPQPKDIEQSKRVLSDDWEQEIKEIESILKSIEIPDHPVELKYYIIQYPKQFIEQYFGAVKEYAGNPKFEKYLLLCEEFIEVLSMEIIEK